MPRPAVQVIRPVGAALRVLQTGPRLLALLGAAESLVLRIARLVDDIEITRREIAALSERVDMTSAVAAGVTGDAAAVVERLGRLLDAYEPAPQAAQPVVDHIANGLNVVDPDALITALQRAPALLDTMDNEVLPMLQTLKTVGPDIHDLLDSSRTLNEMLGGLPGLGRIKKRLDQEADEADEADEAPDGNPPA